MSTSGDGKLSASPTGPLGRAGGGDADNVSHGKKRRFSAQMKLAAVQRLLRGEPLELVARELGVTAAKLSEWRDKALLGAMAELKEREQDVRDHEIARLQAKVGETTMEVELLRDKIRRMEAGGPLARRRPSR